MTASLTLVACGGAAPTESVIEHEAPATGEVFVYAWDGGELVGLYCFAQGALHTDDCHWPASLELGGRELTLDMHARRLVDGSIAEVASYGTDPELPALVIVSDAGQSIWNGGSGPQLVLDRAGVSLGELPRLRRIGGNVQRLFDPDPRPTFEVASYTHVGLAAIDLDHDGVDDVIYLGDDFVAAEELAGGELHVHVGY